MSESTGITGLLEDFQALGGTMDELAEEIRSNPESVAALAAHYGLGDSDLQQLVELNELANKILAGEICGKKEPQPVETRRQMVKRMARELMAYRDALERGEVQVMDREGEPTNAERFPALLEEYQSTGGDVEEFNALEIEQLAEMGAPLDDLAEGLARKMWERSEWGGPWAELGEEERAEVIELVKGGVWHA